MNKNLMIVIAALLVIFGLVMSGYNNLVGMNETSTANGRRLKTSCSAATI